MCQLAVVYSAARREVHDEKAKVPGKSVWAGVVVVKGNSERSKATAASPDRGTGPEPEQQYHMCQLPSRNHSLTRTSLRCSLRVKSHHARTGARLRLFPGDRSIMARSLNRRLMNTRKQDPSNKNSHISGRRLVAERLH